MTTRYHLIILALWAIAFTLPAYADDAALPNNAPETRVNNNAPEPGTDTHAPEPGAVQTITPVAECFSSLPQDEAFDIRRNFDNPYQECLRRVSEKAEKAEKAEKEKQKSATEEGATQKEDTKKPAVHEQD